ncbi:ead/Ea22-like family protein [Cronobacter dublinensis]|nr:ead/Ea22-like family protein [Cronobacter dublinensis]ELY3972305.1 ead/Ea22-like family protein [Cronobacter dublinensis]ELY4483561.1 ead/Ea22-like family protein [Cronobacter dublinensis]ELY4487925.1 ead/Ea22-like family protein [Cronobacter dublinensis]ELY5822735.1 ead/Ea22-like family protein [Cronobacter dublinensis]
MNTAKLKAAAEKARWGDWSAYKPHSGARGYEVRVGSEAVAQHCLKDDAAFIAESSPKAVLCLIAALEAAQKRNAELEKRVAELEARKITVRFDTIPMSELGNVSDGKAHPYLFGAGYNSATVRCKSELQLACAAAGIILETGGEA